MADQFQEAIGVASATDEEISFALPTHMGWVEYWKSAPMYGV